MAVAELELVRKSLLEALERHSEEPDAAISIAVEAVRKAFALIPVQRRREDRFSELAFKLQSLERAFRASRARVRVSAPGAEREQALKDAKADLEEALSIVEQLSGASAEKGVALSYPGGPKPRGARAR